MASHVASIERIDQRPTAVDPRAIEDEFARIWRETSGDKYDESSIRLRVLNLVALAHEPQAPEQFERLMQVLPQRHPCRGILALAAPGYDRLDASISAHCWSTGAGSRHVCSEEVLLTGAPEQEQALASAVLALLVPELPLVVWLMGRPDLADHLNGELIEAADQVFFDTGGADDIAEAFAAVRDAARARAPQPSDLTWGRLSTWRVLCAQFFDSQEGLRQLSQISSIEIVGAAGRPSSEALLFAGWLLSRLGLSVADQETHVDRIAATLYERTRGVRLTIEHGPGDGPPLREVRLRTAEAAFTLQRHLESRHMHVIEDWSGTASRRTVESMPGDDASVIAAALDDYADPAVYAEALDAALALLGA